MPRPGPPGMSTGTQCRRVTNIVCNYLKKKKSKSTTSRGIKKLWLKFIEENIIKQLK